MNLLAPQSAVSEAEQRRGLRLLVVEAAFSGGTVALTSGVILTAFALHLGASNIWIGVLASAPFLTQLLQVPAILLVERLRARKRIAVVTSVAGRLLLLVMAACAFFPGGPSLVVFLFALYALCSLSAFGACAWNAWLRDLAPDDRLGKVFAARTGWSAAISLIAGLSAALLLDFAPEGSKARSLAFAGMFVAGCVTGLISARIVSAMPEQAMPPPSERVGLSVLLREPLADANFVRLLRFVVSWQFAVNLATPFFTVFIVSQLGFDVSMVMVLSALSQLANLLALRNWGVLSDRFTNKSVLMVSGPAYILGIVAMIVASQSESAAFVVFWLALLHILMGGAVAGVTLASANIAMKLSPKGSATAYVATNALATAVAAGIAPIVGGMLAEFFARRKLELLLRWSSPDGQLSLPLALTHWDFYFLLSGAIGLYALHRLSLVEERGAIDRTAMMGEILAQTRRSMRNISSVVGLKAATELPGSLVWEGTVKSRLARAQNRLLRRSRSITK
jgi:MFS family permease